MDDNKEIIKNYNWYECIEEPVRDLVFHLRNNGFNTESSCGHEKWIQCQYIPDGQLMQLHHLIWCYFSEHNLPINFNITVEIKVIDGFAYESLYINLNKFQIK